MNKILLKQFLRPLFLLFILINALTITFGTTLDKKGIDHSVLLYANILLFMLSIITALLHAKALHNSNGYAFVRSITISTFLKLIIIGAGVLIYLMTAGDNRSIYAVAASMVLYIFYTILEVNGAVKMNRKKNAES